MLTSQIQSAIFKPSPVIRLMAFCWLIIKLFCYKLWLANRDFPLVPVHDILLTAPPFVHSFFFAMMLFALSALVFFPSKKWLIVLFMVAELGSCLLDQNRWKPWEYQFMFMLLPVVFLQDEKRIKICWQIIIVGLYFFSGLSKCNSGFILRVWNALILHEWMGITSQNPWVYRLGYALPLIEMAAGIALLFYRTRKFAVAILCLMHIMLFIMLGPPAGNYTNAIWPWNLLMIFLLLYLFYSNYFEMAVLKQKQLLVWAIALCWWVMPWLNLAGYWDDYFSAVLYSGKSQNLYICTSNIKTKTNYRLYFKRTSNEQPCDSMLSVSEWGMQTMNIVPNPEERVYRSIIRQWKLKNDSSGSDRFFILYPKHTKIRWLEIKVNALLFK